jgi:hypothetical protein
MSKTKKKERNISQVYPHEGNKIAIQSSLSEVQQ